MGDWLRVRFKANGDDYRVVQWPPVGPYWCTGYDSQDRSVVVAYVKQEEQITEFWPEAEEIDVHESNVDLKYSDRFPEPVWWRELDREELSDEH